VRLFDPMLALDGGPDGLTAYRDICALLPQLLAPGGLAIFEVGIGQADDVAQLMQAAGLSETGTQADLAGVGRAVFGWLR
jgi:release factor glutamine methyltransferase